MSDLAPLIELALFEGVTVRSVIELACHDASCRPPTSGGTGGSLPASESRISTRTPTGKGTTAELQGMTTEWDQVPTEQKLAMAHRLVDKVDGFKDIKRENFGSDEAFCSAVVDRVAANVENTFSHVSPEDWAAWRNWYPAVRILSEEWAAEYGLQPHQVAAVFASLSPGAGWDHNVEMVRLVLETAVKHSNDPMTPEAVKGLNRIIGQMNSKARDAKKKKVAKAEEVSKSANSIRQSISDGAVTPETAAMFKTLGGKKPSKDHIAASKLVDKGRVNPQGLAIAEQILQTSDTKEKASLREKAKELLGVEGYAQHMSLAKVLSDKSASFDKASRSKVKIIKKIDPKKGAKIADLPPELAGIAVRAVAGEHRTVPRVVISANGKATFDGILKNDSGSDTQLRWSTAGFLADAVSITRDGSLANISKRLGEAHKVRNFYNNIVDPADPSGFTADSHAFGIGIGTPVGLSHPYIGTTGKNGETAVSLPSKPHFASTGFKGVYALIQAGNARALDKINRTLPKEEQMILRELQSVTWEQWRADYPTEYRADKSGKGGAVSKIQAVYRERDAGKIDWSESMRRVDMIRADVQEAYRAKLAKEREKAAKGKNP